MATNDIYDSEYPEPTGSGSVTARYIKLTFNNALFSSISYVQDIEIATSNGGTSLLGSESYTSSDASFSAIPHYFQAGAWLKIDLGSSQTVDTIGVGFGSGASLSFINQKYLCDDMKIETSTDDVTYTERFDGRIASTSYNKAYSSTYYYTTWVMANGEPRRYTTLTNNTAGGAGYQYYMLEILRTQNDGVGEGALDTVKLSDVYFTGATGTLYPVTSLNDSNAAVDNDSTTLSTLLYSGYTAAQNMFSGASWDIFDFKQRTEVTAVKLYFANTGGRPAAFKLYGSNSPNGHNGTFDLLLYVNDYNWGSNYSASFAIDTGSTGAAYTATGYVIRNGVGVEATVRFYNHSTGAFLYETTSSAVDGAWYYRSGTNTAIDVVVIGEESEGLQIEGNITPTAS